MGTFCATKVAKLTVNLFETLFITQLSVGPEKRQNGNPKRGPKRDAKNGKVNKNYGNEEINHVSSNYAVHYEMP